MVTQCSWATARKEWDIYLLQTVASSGYKTYFNCLCLSISLGKNSPANVIKVLAANLNLLVFHNLITFLFGKNHQIIFEECIFPSGHQHPQPMEQQSRCLLHADALASSNQRGVTAWLRLSFQNVTNGKSVWNDFQGVLNIY